MEQEPTYVPAKRLTGICETLLGKIYDTRQANKERYVMDRVFAYNAQIVKKNRWRKLFHLRPKMFITPVGMELAIKDEIDHMPDADKINHPMIEIHRVYGQLEHEAKDAMIMCQYNDTVAISADLARGISHMGIDLRPLSKVKFGFTP